MIRELATWLRWWRRRGRVTAHRAGEFTLPAAAQPGDLLVLTITNHDGTTTRYRVVEYEGELP